MLLSVELGIPYVVSVHGLDAFSTVQVTGRAGQWCGRISQRVYKNSRRVICISEHVRERVLERAGSSCRTSVVFNGVDPKLFLPADQESTDAVTIVSVGNLIPIKGHDLLVRAAASLAPDFPELRWEIIGDGAERGRLQALAAQLHVNDRVIFLGRQSRKQVAVAMQRCTLFALPSRYEGLGCVYLEAMACGKPVIGCNGQGINEIIEDGKNGVLVSPGDEAKLSDALKMLLNNEPLRERMGNAGYKTVRSRHTIAHQAVQLTEIYRECVR